MPESDALNLSTLSPEGLKEVLIKEGQTRRRSINAIIGGGCALLAVYVFLIVLQIVTGKGVDWDFLLTQFGLIGCFTSVWGLTQNHKHAVQQASQWQDPTLAPHLLEVMDADASDIRKVCESALARLLPKLTRAHANLFTLGQIKRLMKLAKSSKSDLAFEAVKTLGKVGDRHTPAELELFAGSKKAGDSRSEKLAALALEAAADLRLELAREIVTAKSASQTPSASKHHSLELPTVQESDSSTDLQSVKSLGA